MLKKKLKRKRGQSNNYTTPSNFDSDFCLWGQRRTKEREEEEERRLKRGGGREEEEERRRSRRHSSCEFFLGIFHWQSDSSNNMNNSLLAQVTINTSGHTNRHSKGDLNRMCE